MVRKRSRLPAGITLLDDGRYKIRGTVVVPDTRVRKDRVLTLPQGTTLIQAIAALEDLREEMSNPVVNVPVPSAPSLKLCSQHHLSRLRGRGRAATTLEAAAYNIAHCLSLELVPDLPIDQYTRADLVALRTRLEAVEGSSAVSIRAWWGEWRRMVRAATRDLGLPDPGQDLDGPAVSSPPARERRTLSRRQISQVIEHVEATSLGSDYQVLIAVLAYAGVRLGEALALKWARIDLDARTITVAESVTWTRTAGWQTKVPKNGKIRKVGLGLPLEEILRAHRASLIQSGRLPVGLVCQAESGGHLQSTRVRSRLQATSKALGFDLVVTPQVLRRTWNTLALEVIDRVLVQAQMGHADDSMSSHYLGVRDETLVTSADRMWDLNVGHGQK